MINLMLKKIRNLLKGKPAVDVDNKLAEICMKECREIVARANKECAEAAIITAALKPHADFFNEVDAITFQSNKEKLSN